MNSKLQKATTAVIVATVVACIVYACTCPPPPPEPERRIAAITNQRMEARTKRVGTVIYKRYLVI